LPPGQAVKAEILRNLTVGDEGDDVIALQELLLAEGVYPEGLITGYFGSLTKQAVIRFQEKYKDEILTPAGLSGGTGFVGPSTRAKINSF
jgi:peptidoglycan hydrolase-like protein with peptidoglycan-binding domain